jgi:alpha-L-fucosidase 2
VPGRAVDGVTNGAWSGGSVTHTAAERQPWWQVDLGDRHEISQIAIWNRTDSCCAARLTDFHVLVSDEPFASGSLEEVLAQPGVWSFHVPGRGGAPTTIDVGRTGRYVRVQLTGTNPLSLAEVQVFGG